MATEFEAILTDNVSFIHTGDIYVTVQSAESSDYMSATPENSKAGQKTSGSGFDWVFRSGFRFDLSGLPASVNITATTLKLYGVSDPVIDFNLQIVAMDLSDPPVNSDYSKLGTAVLGTFATVGWTNGSYNTINFNAAGLVAINAGIQTGMLEIGVRSDNDISATAPGLDDSERLSFAGITQTNIPILTLTYPDWPDSYPIGILFPVTGKIDLITYGVIKDYMEGIDNDLALIADNDGNVDLAVANYIWWTGTSEKIAYDNGTSRVTVTTLESTSAITIAADLVTADPSITTTATAVDATVTNDVQLSNTAYTSIQSKITDNEVVFSGVSAPSPADDEGYIYMDSTSGDFIIKTRDDGQSGTKTAILGDFSAM